MITRRLLVSLGTATLVAAIPGLASATPFWKTSGGGNAAATAGTLLPPAAVSSSSQTTTTLVLKVDTGPASGGTPTSYRVDRTSAVAPGVATGVCTISAVGSTCTDTGLTPSTSYSYVVRSKIGSNWLSAASSTVTVSTAAAPQAFVVTASSPQTAGGAFNITIQAKNTSGNDTSYTGVKTLTFSGPANAPDGTAPSYGTATFNSSGLATVSVTLQKAETVAIAVSDSADTARNASSGSVVVNAGAINRLWFTSSSADCSDGSVTVSKNTTGAWTSKLSVADAHGNVVPNNATARTLSPSFNANHTLGSNGSTTIASNANPSETTTALSVNSNSGNKVGTLTVTGTSLTSAACTITGN